MNFERAVEAMIKEATERGEFDKLPGKGKPIGLSAYFDTPEEVRMALRLHGATALGANSAEFGFTNPACPAILAGVEVDFLGAQAPFVLNNRMWYV